MAFLLILLVEKLMKVQKLANLKQRKEKWKSDQNDFYFKEIPVMFGLGLCVVSLMMYGVSSFTGHDFTLMTLLESLIITALLLLPVVLMNNYHNPEPTQQDIEEKININL